MTGSCKMLVKSGSLLSSIALVGAALFNIMSLSSVTISLCCLELVGVSLVPVWSAVGVSSKIAGGRNPETGRFKSDDAVKVQTLIKLLDAQSDLGIIRLHVKSTLSTLPSFLSEKDGK